MNCDLCPFRGVSDFLLTCCPSCRTSRTGASAVGLILGLLLGLTFLIAPRASAQIFGDDFADGQVSVYWQQVSASPAVTMVERNGRAELTTLADSTLTEPRYAGLLSRGWSIRCTSNWAARAVVHSQPRTNGTNLTKEYVSVGTFRPGSPLGIGGFPGQSKLWNVGTIYIQPPTGNFNRRVEYTGYDQSGNASYLATPWAANAGYPFEFYTAVPPIQYAFDFSYTETIYLQYVAASDTLYVSTYFYNDPDSFFFTNWTGGQRYPIAFALGGFAVKPQATTGANTWIDSFRVDVGVIDTAPGNVTASDGTFGNKVRITWTAAANATGYKVLRQAPGGTVEQVAQLGQAALAYDDTTAVRLVEYTYFVRTINANGDGFEFSDTGWRNVDVPTEVAATDGTFTDKIRVTWAPSTGATGYSVWRAIGTGTPVLLGQTSGENETTYDDATAAIATTYSYSIKATSALGPTGFSTADTGVRAPAPPENVAASEGEFATKVRVSWTALNGATGYRIYRRVEGGVAAQIGSVASGTTNFFDDTTATPLTTYLYSVKTTTTAVDSDVSAEESGWRNLTAPTLAGSLGTSEAGVVLTWSAIAGASGYELFRAAPGGQPEPLATLGVVTTFTDRTAEPLIVYSYTAKTVHDRGVSPGSTAVSGWRNTAGPSTVTATDGAFANKVQLEWAAVGGATGYSVWRKVPSAANFTQIASIAGGTTLTYADSTAAVATTYLYAVKATNSVGSTALSPSDSGWRNTSAPPSVAATDGTETTKVRVTWGATPSATGYKVFRAEASGEPAEIATLPASARAYDDVSAVAAVQYSYTVRATLAPGLSPPSAANDGWRATAAPTAVAASDGTFTDRVRVTWASVAGASGYKVFRKQGSSTAALIGTIMSGAETSFDDMTPLVAVSYSYSVRSLCPLGFGGMSAFDVGIRAPAAPASVHATEGTETAKVRITWTSVGGATGYKIYRRATGSPTATLVGTINSGNTTGFDDTTAAPITAYLYSVKTRVGTTDSAPSDEDNGWRNVPGPTLAASQGTSSDGVVLSWSATTGATGYQIFRAAPGGSSQPLSSVETVTTFTDTTADPLVIYTYSAKVVHALGISPIGPSVTGFRNIPGPAAMTATDGAFSNKVQVDWSAVTGATGYSIWRKLPTAASFAQIGSVSNGATLTYADTSAAVGTSYDYAVKAIVGAAPTAFGPADGGWRNTTAPGSVAATDGTDAAKVRITWGAAPSATGYKVFRAESGGEPVEIASLATSARTYDDVAALPAVLYSYTVRATLAAGLSPPSTANTGWRQVATPVVSASDGTFDDKVQVTWPVVAGASSYKVFRKIGSGANTQIGTVAAGETTEFNDTTINPVVNGNYSVQVVSPLGNGPTSTVNIGWRNRPAPTSVAATDGSFPTKVRVTWSSVTSATGYRVYRQIGGGAVTQVGSTNASTLAFDDTTIAVGQTGSYTVRATHALGLTAPSIADEGFRAPPLGGDSAFTGGGTGGGAGGGTGGGDGAADEGGGDDGGDTSDDRPTVVLGESCLAVEARITDRLASADLADDGTRAMLESLLAPPERGDGTGDDAAATTTACAILAGDVDLDGHVTASDLVAFLAAWTARDEFHGDVNRDGFIDAIDYAEVYLRVAEGAEGSDESDESGSAN